MKILIIEDEAGYQKILKSSFEKEGFEVIISRDAEQGRVEVIKNRPDIILLDIILPSGLNGFDFLEQLKADKKSQNIPVVVITNLETEEKVSKEIGADFYFVKAATTIPQIIEKIKELVNFNT